MGVHPALSTLAAAAMLVLTGCAHSASPHHPRFRQEVQSDLVKEVRIPTRDYLHCGPVGRCWLSHQPFRNPRR